MKKCTRIATRFASAAAAAALLFSQAPIAQAGTSIAPTKNGRTGVTYAYYASTDELCVKRPMVGSGGYIATGYGQVNTLNTKRGDWNCLDLKEAGARENEQVKFFLFTSDGLSKSIGYLYV